MNCGNCTYTDGCCYTSIPPKVKCNITGEFHHYEDECNCEDVKAKKIEEFDKVRELFCQPGALMAVNYGSDKAPAATITGGEAAVAYESLPDLSLYGESEGADRISIIPKATHIDENAESWKLMAPIEYGSTPCLVCGESIGINTMFGDKRKICASCQKAIKFIKERFKEELENYEL